MTLLLTGAGTAVDTPPYVPDPTVLALGPACWWDASALSLTDGTAVATWADVSGNARTLTQATGSHQPTYKTNIVNGKPVVRFSGAGSAKGMKASAFTLNQPFSVYMAVMMVQTASQASVSQARLLDGNAADSTVIYEASSGSWTVYGGTSNGPAVTPGTSIFHVLTAEWNGASSNEALDGAAFTTASTGTNNAGGFTLGCRASITQGTTSDVAECLVFASQLGSTDRSTVETYLKNKYATP